MTRASNADHDPSPPQGPSSTWRPSARDVSSPTYTGSVAGRPPSAPSPTARQGRHRGRVVAALASLASLAALAAFAAVLLRPADAPRTAVAENVAVLEIARGPVRLLAADADAGLRLLALDAGAPLAVGTVIETGTDPDGSARLASSGAPSSPGRAAPGRAAPGRAAPGRAAFRLAGGESVRLDTDSRVRLASASALVLERGAVYVDAAAGSGVEVRTALGVVSDIGTQFEVRLLDTAADDVSLRVRVREGEVVLRRDDGEARQASAGTELSVAADGTVHRADVAVHGRPWRWVLDAAAVPELEGRSLRDFLDWLAREGGWTLRFADDATAELAATTVLHGDAADLTAMEAADLVFEGSGLGYRVDDHTFRVAPRPVADDAR